MVSNKPADNQAYISFAYSHMLEEGQQGTVHPLQEQAIAVMAVDIATTATAAKTTGQEEPRNQRWLVVALRGGSLSSIVEQILQCHSHFESVMCLARKWGKQIVMV